MSRMGRMPIEIPKGVKVEVRGGALQVEGPKGKVSQQLVPGTEVHVKDGVITVTRQGETGPERAKHGLARALYANAVRGAAEGYSKTLEIIGVGYKAEVKGNVVQFALGYSHPVLFPVPPGIKVDIDAKANKVTVAGADRQMVGQVAARDPQPAQARPVQG